MTYDEAYKAMVAGKRVRRRGWNDESYWSQAGMYLGGRLTNCEPRPFEREMTDWQIVS